MKQAKEIILMGVFMCGLFICQAFPLLAPFKAVWGYGNIVLFLGAFITGFLLAMLDTSIVNGMFSGFFSIILGLILTGFIMILPVLLGMINELSTISAVAIGRSFIFGILLTPVSTVGTFVGIAVQDCSYSM